MNTNHDFPEEWEYDFQPLGEHVIGRPRFTQCDRCGRIVPQEYAVKTATEDYCSEACSREGLHLRQAIEGGF